jgi:hypothetical protein
MIFHWKLINLMNLQQSRDNLESSQLYTSTNPYRKGIVIKLAPYAKWHNVKKLQKKKNLEPPISQ